MTETKYLTSPEGRRLAYAASPGAGPVVVFLSGYRSDMQGTKAVHLETWAQARGQAYLRFDYSGHGVSGGVFEEGCIGDWAADAAAVISAVTTGPVLLVGSSMGGWIGCLLSRQLRQVAGFVGIAAAPDFTEDGFWAGFSEDQRQLLMETGQIAVPSEYEDPYMVTRKLIEDGRQNLVLRSPLNMPWPVRLLQGSQDTAVSRETLLHLFDHIEGPDVQVQLVKGADHRFSEPANLKQIETAIEDVLSCGA